MIRYLPHDEIDKKKWDQCIQHAVNSLPYGYSWYLDIVSADWDAVVADDYSAVFPLPFSKKFGIHYLHQPFFAQQLGLFHTSVSKSLQADPFLEAIPRKFRFAEIFLNSGSFPAHYQTLARDNYELLLDKPMEEIRSHYSQNLRRNLKKSQNQGLSIAPHSDIAEIMQLFRLGRGKEVKHWGENEYLRLTRLFYTAEHLGKARAWGVYSPMNELLAGGLFLFDHHRCILIFSGIGEEGKKLGAMPLLIDHVIAEYHASEMIFDFEGSMDQGLARFYASFGATRNLYWFYTFNKLPFPLNLIKKKLG